MFDVDWHCMEFRFAKAILFNIVTQLLVNCGYGQRPFSIVVDGPKYVRLQPGDPLTIKCNYTKRERDGVEWTLHEPCGPWSRTLFSGSGKSVPPWDVLGDLNMTLIPANQDSLPSGSGTIALAIEKYYVRLPTCETLQIACLVGEDSVNNVDDRVTIKSMDISAHRNTPIKKNTCYSSQVLNCSEVISRTPAVSYNWSIPSDANIVEFSESLNSPVLTVPQLQSGLFQCIVTNAITLYAVQITYAVVSCDPLSAEKEWMWGSIITTCAAVLVMVSAIAVVCKQGPSSEAAGSLVLTTYAASPQDYEPSSKCEPISNNEPSSKCEPSGKYEHGSSKGTEE